MLLGEGVDHAGVPLVQGGPQVGEQRHRRSTQRLPPSARRTKANHAPASVTSCSQPCGVRWL